MPFTYRREALAEACKALLGFDPFERDPFTLEAHAAAMLRDALAEALEKHLA